MADFDLEIEDINPTLDLVLFENIETSYPRDRPLSLIYSLGKEFQPSKRDDWIGIFYSGWRSVNQCLAYRWAPTVPRSRKDAHRRSVRFSESELRGFANDVDYFQFLYVTKGDNVVGVSNSFKFSDSLESQIDLKNKSKDNLLRNSSSLSFVDIFGECSAFRNIPGYDTDLHFETLEPNDINKEEIKTLNNLQNVPGYETDLCFDTLEHSFSSKEKIPMDSEVSRKRSLSDTYEMVDEKIAPEVRKQAKTKQKVLTVVRNTDSTSLTGDFAAKLWNEKLRLVHVMHPIVKDYMDNQERAVVPFVPIKPVYDASQTTKIQKEAIMTLGNTEPPKLEFPLRLALLPGPQSILMGMKDGSKSCKTCAVGFNVVSEIIRLNTMTTEKMGAMEREIKELKSHIRDSHMKDLVTSLHVVGGKNIQGDHCEELLKQNKNLKAIISNLQNQLSTIKPEKVANEKISKESSSKISYNQDDCLQDAILILSKRGYKAIVTPEGKQVNLEDLGSNSSDEDQMWHIRSPKRVERLRSIISKQDATIENANFAMSTQRDVLKKKAKIVRTLRKDIMKTEHKNQELTKKLNDMTGRIRSILRGRAKELTNEWRMLARRIRVLEDPALEPENRNVDYPSLYNTNKTVVPKQQPVTRGTQVYTANDDVSSFKNPSIRTNRVCKTCGVTFTPDVDSRVFEEHMVFHKLYEKKTV